jgi:hypothetical protein
MIALMAAALALTPGTAQALSLVIATSGTQDDPQPAPCGPNRDCDDSLYRSTFSNARTLAGDPLPRAFDARLRLHTPYISRYTLALIVERRGDGSLLVLRQAGFNGRNGIACFDNPNEFEVDWRPSAASVRWQGKTLCLSDAGQINPNAPRD